MNKREQLSDRMVQIEAEAARDLLRNIAEEVEGDDALKADMIEGETGLSEAIERAIGELRECDVISAGCKAEIETLASRKERADRRKDTIRAAIEQAMVLVGLDTFKSATKTLSITRRKGTAVIVDEAAIPAEFWQPQPPKLDKKALNEAVAERDVPGAHLSNGSVSLTIRSK